MEGERPKDRDQKAKRETETNKQAYKDKESRRQYRKMRA